MQAALNNGWEPQSFSRSIPNDYAPLLVGGGLGNL